MIEFIFIIISGSIITFYGTKLVDIAVALSDIVGGTESLDRTRLVEIASQEPELNTLLSQFSQYILLLLFFSCGIFIICKGTNWYLTLKSIDVKINLGRYIRNYIGIHVLLFFILFVISTGYLNAVFYAQNSFPGLVIILQFLLIATLVIVFYGMYAIYRVLEKESFIDILSHIYTDTRKHIKQRLRGYSILLLVICASIIIIQFVYRTNLSLALFIAILLQVSVTVWARYHIRCYL